MVCLIAAAVYANAVGNTFVLDDGGIIRDNALVHTISGVWRGFVEPYWPPPSPAGQYRPIAVASFAFDWVVSGGSPAFMHAMNVAWHVAACFLVWLLLAELLPLPGALIGVIFFALHPVHVEAVSNTVGRCDVMAATFALAALLAHRRGSMWAVAFFALALGSKESGVVVLGLAVANDILLDGGESAVPGEAVGAPRGWAVIRLRWRVYAGYLCVVALYAAAVGLVFRHRSFELVAAMWTGASTVDRWLTMAALVPEYVRLVFAPFHLKIEYSPRDVVLQHTLSWAVLSGLAIIAALGAAIAYCWRRAPAVAYGLAFFAIAIFPVSNVVFPTGIAIAERAFYLPTVGAALVVGWLGYRLVLLRPRVYVPVFAVYMLAFAARTWTRTAFWHDNKRLVITSLLEEPLAYRAHVRAGGVLRGVGDIPGAVHQFAIARDLYPFDPFVDEVGAGLAVAQGDYARAAGLLDSAVALDPTIYRFHAELSRARYRTGDYAGAIREARAAYSLDRDSVDVLTVATLAAQQLGDLDAARAAFSAGLADHPEDAALHRGFSEMLAAAGDTAASHREARRAARGGR